MAMNVGSGGISRGDPEVMIDINTTPLIDVMLVLLVMLIITLPIQLHAINLNMPTGNPPPPLVLPQIVKIDIDSAGTTYWNGEVVPEVVTIDVDFDGTVLWNGQAIDDATLQGKLQNVAGMPDQPEVHLRPDKASKYAVTAGVMASAQRLGLTKIGIVGSEQFIEE